MGGGSKIGCADEGGASLSALIFPRFHVPQTEMPSWPRSGLIPNAADLGQGSWVAFGD